MLLSVAPKTDFEGDRKIVRVTATSTGNSTKQDAVKAITIVESTSAAACQVTSLSAVPTRAGAQLTFALSSDARVTATVLNVAGRPIKTILADKPLAAGVQTLVWNRTDNAGLAVPHGTYLVRVTARDRAGGEASALGSLVLR
jgi:flagellar hook assembly protein FlgD